MFGKNPSLPGILSDKLPALEGVTTSKVVAEHINALHAGRKAFAEVQCDESIRRALRHRVRAAEKVFKPGNKVYYKRDGQDRWNGPAVVIGNDGSVYYIRHRGNLYRVAACRLNDIEDSPMDVSEETLKNDQPNSVEETRNGDTKFKQSFSLHNSSAQDLPNTTDAGEITDNVENMEVTEHIEEVPAEANLPSSATLPDQLVEISTYWIS